MPASPGYGVEWKTVKGSNGSNIRIYTRNCDWCQCPYEGRGARFCGKRCAVLWGRATKDYSKAKFPCGRNNPISIEFKNFSSLVLKEKFDRS
jgi:hypothetical protein